MHRSARFIYFKLLGWKPKGEFPPLDQCVVIVLPHTHWTDFFLGLHLRKVLNEEINHIGKKSLFKPPIGWFFRWTGGAPVDRSTPANILDSVVRIFGQGGGSSALPWPPRGPGKRWRPSKRDSTIWPERQGSP